MMGATTVNETLGSLLELLGIDGEAPAALVEMGDIDGRYLRDLKINVSNVFSYETLSAKERALVALSVAINEKNDRLTRAFRAKAGQEGASPAELSEIAACVSLLNVNNVFYRFRHFTNKAYYRDTPAGIKMSVMAFPVNGKELFELVSLVVSALNGCELCVNSHEESLVKLGTPQQRIYDAIRLASVIKGATVFF